jgi:hypothetical protein
MTKVFFHIGLHKTGTTWLQNQFFSRLDGVKVLHTRHLGRVIVPAGSSTTLIVSHAGLSGTLSNEPPGNNQLLTDNLRLIAEFVADTAIIIGFREHASWLHAAYSNKAKKTWGMSPKNYVQVFSFDDLSWCKKLDTIEQFSAAVFPFFYEELLWNPHALVDDLCKFLGKAPPANLDQLLKIRENSSPRTQVGQFVSRALYALSAASRRQLFKPQCGPLGARFDRFFSIKPIALKPEMARALQQDWNDLLQLIGQHRRRDFSSLAPKDVLHEADLHCGHGP